MIKRGSNYVKCLYCRILSPEVTSLIRVGFPICNHLVSYCYLLKRNQSEYTSPPIVLPPPRPLPLRFYIPHPLHRCDGSLHALQQYDEPIIQCAASFKKIFADKRWTRRLDNMVNNTKDTKECYFGTYIITTRFASPW